MRKFTILGVTLADYHVREALRRTEQFLRSGAMNTIAYISYTDLAAAARMPEQKEQIERLDLTLSVETAMLEAAGIAAGNRLREIEEGVYLREFLRRLGRSRRKVFLLTMETGGIETFRRTVEEFQDNLNILQCRSVEEYGGKMEKLLNDLNEAAPDAILSALPFSEALTLMETGRKYLNAEVWLALPEKKIPGYQKQSVIEKIRKKLFQKKVNQFEE